MLQSVWFGAFRPDEVINRSYYSTMQFPWTEEIAIDLGTANTQICVKDAGVVVREPSVIAFDEQRRRSVAVGLEAKRMLERDVEQVRVVRPVRNGVVADFDGTVSMLSSFLRQALGKRPIFSPVVVTSVPDKATQVERRALIDAIRAAGGGRVLPVRKALATAIGAGLDVGSDISQMVVDLGAGMTNVGIIAMGTVTAGLSVRFGGDDLDEVIRRAIRRTKGVRISCAAAEQIKLHVGTLGETKSNKSVQIEGVADEDDTAVTADVDLHRVPLQLVDGLNYIAREINWLIEQLGPQQQNEIAENGVVLTGGTAMLNAAEAYFTEGLGVPSRVATNPPSCTILGLESVLNNTDGISLQGRRFRGVGQ